MSEIIAPSRIAPREAEDLTLRPKRLADFVGQKTLRENLSVFIEAARQREGTLDHILFFGPPGLGKTTLARIAAREMEVTFRVTSGPVLAKPGDLAAILTHLKTGDVLFIDEIHRLSPVIEEILYPAMEDFQLDVLIGTGPAARNLRLDLARFTLIGATTRAGLLTRPMRERFGIPLRLHYYPACDLEEIVTRQAQAMQIGLAGDGAREIATRARGTPRIAGRLLRRVWDFAVTSGQSQITRNIAARALARLEVDKYGLDQFDRDYLQIIAQKFNGGPVGVETIATAMSEARDSIEDVIEPYLVRLGFVQRSPRGRILSSSAFAHLGLPEPCGRNEGQNGSLFPGNPPAIDA